MELFSAIGLGLAWIVLTILPIALLKDNQSHQTYFINKFPSLSFDDNQLLDPLQPLLLPNYSYWLETGLSKLNVESLLEKNRNFFTEFHLQSFNENLTTVCQPHFYTNRTGQHCATPKISYKLDITKRIKISYKFSNNPKGNCQLQLPETFLSNQIINFLEVQNIRNLLLHHNFTLRSELPVNYTSIPKRIYQNFNIDPKLFMKNDLYFYPLLLVSEINNLFYQSEFLNRNFTHVLRWQFYMKVFDQIDGVFIFLPK